MKSVMMLLLELYLKIDKLRNNVDNIRMDDIKEIINHAIAKAENAAQKDSLAV